MCEGIKIAHDCGFRHLRSIEIHEPYYKQGLERLADYSNITLYHGKTEDLLSIAIKNSEALIREWESEHQISEIEKRITFWIDGHFSGIHNGIKTPGSENNCPLLIELDIIKKSGRKHDNILLDDLRCCNTELFEDSIHGRITKEMIEQKLLEINPDYKLEYHDSWEPRDILSASV